MLMLELMLCVSCCWRFRCVLWTLKKDKETPAFPSQYLSFIKLVGVADSSAADFHGNSYKNCQNWAHVGHDACWSLVQWRRDEVIIFATAATLYLCLCPYLY